MQVLRMGGSLLEGLVMTSIHPRNHARRAKPLVGIRAVARMLLRSVDATLPEAQLVVAVIAQAIYDCALAEPSERSSAQRFMRSWRLDVWAEAVGLNPEFVREVAIKTLYLSPPVQTSCNLQLALDVHKVKNIQKHKQRSSDARLQ